VTPDVRSNSWRQKTALVMICLTSKCLGLRTFWKLYCRVQLKCDGTRWSTGVEVKGKLANGVGSQYPSHYLGTWCIQHYYRWCAHLGCRLNWRHPADLNGLVCFSRKTKSGFCACAITFQTQCTNSLLSPPLHRHLSREQRQIHVLSHLISY